MRIVVCGGRNYSNFEFLIKIMDELLRDYIQPPNTIQVRDKALFSIATGGATGADTLAERWARMRGIKCKTYLPDWNRYGDAAGPKRNIKMIDTFAPDLLVAFKGGFGTASSIKHAKSKGIKVFTPDEDFNSSKTGSLF